MPFSKVRRAQSSAVVLLIASSLFQVAATAQTATCTNWKFFNVPSLPDTNPRGISRWGTIVGDAEPSNSFGPVGFTRYSDGTIKTYRVAPGVGTFLTKRNAQGVTVGWAYSNVGTDGLVISGSNVVHVNYPDPYASGTILYGINYWGSMVGVWSNTGIPFTAPWSSFELKNGSFIPIAYPGAATTNANAISDTGVIVGYYNHYLFNGRHVPNHGFVFKNGVYTTLDNPNGTGGTVLNDSNSSGVIAGTYVHFQQFHGFIYAKGVFKDIKVPNYPYSTVDGINGYGDVTGMAYGSTTAAPTAYAARCQ